MSLLTLPSTILGYAKSAVTSLPGLLKRRPEKPVENEESINTYKKAINNFTATKIDDAEMTFDLAPKLQGLMEQIESQNPNIDDGTIEFRRIIGENVIPETLAGVQNITYNSVALENDFKKFIDMREQNYIQRMDEILTRNKKEAINDFTQFDEIFYNFFIESLTLLHNLNNIIFHRVISSEDFKASDLDIANAFKHTQDLTKVLSKKILGDFQILLNRLPIEEGKEEDTKAYSDEVKKHFQNYTEILLRGKYYGILDKDFAEAYMSHYLEKIDRGETLSNVDLSNISQFHEGMHGCLLLRPSLQASRISSLDLDITKTSIQDLNRNIINLSQIKTNTKSDKERKQIIDYRIANIIKNLSKMAKTEKRVNESLELFSQDKTAVRLGIPRERILEMAEIHESIAGIEKYIGRTEEDLIVGRTQDGSVHGQKFPEEALVNIFTLRGAAKTSSTKSYSRDFSEQYERLVLETSLLAGYHVLAQQMDGISDEKIENVFKDKKLFANFSQENVPWLKTFYYDQIESFKEIVKNDKSPRKTADLARKVCNLCQRLASPDIDIYQSNDFFRRYDLANTAENALKRVGAMTDVNTMSLALKVYSEIFSNLVQDAEAAGLSKTETKWLSTHVEYLKKLSEIENEAGEILYAPATGNPHEQKKFDEIEAVFKDTNLVSYNIDLVLKYFRNAINEKKNTERQDKDNYSDLKSRNLLLSSALVYYYLKFMPGFSKDAESLRSREKIIETIFDPQTAISRHLPKELGPKILDHFLGTESDASGKPISAAKYERQGFLRSYALELETKLDNYIQGKEYKRVPLNDLLQAYYRLEIIKTESNDRAAKRNPIIVGKDPSTIENDKLLGLWGRQVKVHVKFFNGKDKELLPPLKTKLKSLLKEHSSEVMKFIETIPDETIKQETSEFISKELFKQAATTAKEILARKENGVIEVTDDNTKLMTQITSTFGNLSRISKLIYKGNYSNFNLSENSVLGEDDRKEFANNLELVQTLIKSKFLLVDVINKTGEKVRRTKDIALNLLKAFNVRPKIGNHLQWLSENQVESYIDQQQRTVQINDSIDNRQESQSNLANAA